MTVLLLLTLLWGTAGGSFLPTITRLSLHSCNDVTLVCQVLTVQGFSVRVENAHFLANDTNIQDLLTGTEFDDSVEGEIRFTLRQQLEALYKCGNDSFTSTNSIPLTSCPTRTEVDRYHAVPVGQEVSLECGVRQGKLGSYYHPEWRKGSPTVDTISPDSLYRLQREELEDFALTFLNPSLSDSGMYSCDVEIEQENGQSFFAEEDNQVELLVYERPVITYMTEDTTAIVHNGGSKNVTFFCNATGSPDLMVLWYHNGERVTSKEKYSTHETTYTTEGSVSSRLTMSDPRLTDSGTMTCQAKVSFRADAGNAERSIETASTETTRNIIILDTSPSVKVTVTQDSDLLVRISLGDTVLQQPVTLNLKFTSKETGETTSNRPDSKYSDLSIIYHFIPASQIPDGYRRFWLQVALVVDDKMGPYNPPVLTSPLVTDLNNLPDECEEMRVLSTIEIIVVVVLAALVVVVIGIGVIVASIKIHQHNKKHTEELERIEREHQTNKRKEIREARKNVLEILPLISEDSPIMDVMKQDLEDFKTCVMADGADEEQEVDYQKALRDYIERLRSVQDTEDGFLSEQFTHKLEELYSRISPTAEATTGIAGSCGEHMNRPQIKESNV